MGLRWGLCAWFEYQTYSNLRAIPTAQRADHARQKLSPYPSSRAPCMLGFAKGLTAARVAPRPARPTFAMLSPAADVGKRAPVA